MVGILVFQSILNYVTTYLSGLIGQNIIRDIRIKLFRHLLNLKLKFYDKSQIGRLQTRNISDIETLNEVFSQGLANIFGDLLQVFFILGYMFYLNWRLTLVSLSMLPFLIVSTYIFKEKIKNQLHFFLMKIE